MIASSRKSSSHRGGLLAGSFDPDETAQWLARLLTTGRFGPMFLEFRGGVRVHIRRPEDVALHCERGTIRAAATGCPMQEYLIDDLLAVGLRPRRLAAEEPDGG